MLGSITEALFCPCYVRSVSGDFAMLGPIAEALFFLLCQACFRRLCYVRSKRRGTFFPCYVKSVSEHFVMLGPIAESLFFLVMLGPFQETLLCKVKSKRLSETLVMLGPIAETS